MEFNSNNSKPNKPKDEKKTYSAPELIIYGSIREITRNLGEKGALDAGGGAGMGPKTQT
jgi:hypothetical protein